MVRRLVAGLLLLAAGTAGGEPPLWVAVGARELLEAVRPLAEERARQGMATLLVDGADRLPRAPSYLLYLGTEPARRCEYYRWRPAQPDTFASDAREEFPVGRIPARTPDEVAIVVRKTLAWERRRRAPEELRLLAWAGAPGYNALVDSFATSMLTKTVRDNAPAWAGHWLISADPRQALCGPPQEQPLLFSAELRRGAILGAFVAHASAQAVHSMGDVWFGVREARALLGEGEPTAPLLFLACNCGEFGGEERSLTEELLFLPGGPAAAVGATTESHPLPNFYTGRALLRTLAEGPDRLGDVWLAAQKRARGERDPALEAMLRDVEGKLEPTIDVAKLQRDQFLLYVLLGDPALRLGKPLPLEAAVVRTESGWRWRVPKVPGAKRLVVGKRALQRIDLPAPPGGAEAKRKAFVEANAREEFETVATMEGEGPWEGETAEPGRLRLVAETEGGLLVATLDCR
jgi:hypothetical protein